MKAGIFSSGLFAILFLTACSEGDKSHASHEASESAATEPGAASSPPATQQVRLKQAGLHAVYQHYLHLSNAFVKEDAAEVRIAAAAIREGARNMPGAEKLASSSKKIMESSDIEQQRRSFSDLSNELISLTKNSGLETGELYVDYCPMAMNNEGAYWLSATKEIVNPYYGDEMLNCGEIKETIK